MFLKKKIYLSIVFQIKKENKSIINNYISKHVTVVYCGHLRRRWCFWFSSWPQRPFTLQLFQLATLIGGFSLTQGPEMSVTLSGWASKRSPVSET